MGNTFDWEEDVYGQGKALNRYPFDMFVSFLYQNFDRTRPRSETRILELGCGAGNNLWFAAREGFTVAGMDGSSSAIEYARRRFEAEGLSGDLRVGDFTQPLPFADAQYDFVLDRGALTCVGFSAVRRVITEVQRVLLPGGKFYFSPYSDRHSGHISGKPGPDGVTRDITTGLLVGIGEINFYGKRQVLDLFGEGWQVVGLRHIEWQEMLEPAYMVHAEWRVVAEKR